MIAFVTAVAVTLALGLYALGPAAYAAIPAAFVLGTIYALWWSRSTLRGAVDDGRCLVCQQATRESAPGAPPVPLRVTGTTVRQTGETVRILAWPPGGQWTAQCLEYDVAAQAPGLQAVLGRVEDTLADNAVECERRGQEPLSNLKPAPDRLFDLWGRLE